MSDSNCKSEFKLGDDVLRRIVQIVQEGILLGVDVVDLMRVIKLESSDAESNVLQLTADYKKSVVDMHERLVARAEELARTETSIVDPEKN